MKTLFAVVILNLALANQAYAVGNIFTFACMKDQNIVDTTWSFFENGSVARQFKAKCSILGGKVRIDCSQEKCGRG